MKNSNSRQHSPVLLAFKKILHPLVRLALTRRIPIQVIIDMLKKHYVAVCQEEFSLSDKRLTDSRISVLTGLQRKDIKSIRILPSDEELRADSSGTLARVIAHWQSSKGYQDSDGIPLALEKSGEAPSFDSLVGMISQDIHPRTLLDDLISLDHVEVDNTTIRLITNAFLPRGDDQALLGYLADNLGDHTTAAIDNVISAPSTAPHFERAVHYSHLSTEALNELEILSRKLQQKTLEKINAHALKLQTRDRTNPSATGRFRCGAFIYCQEQTNKKTREENS